MSNPSPEAHARQPRLRAHPPEYVDASETVEIDLNELRARRAPDGKHLWVMTLAYYLPDPELALDDMVLGVDNLMALGQIQCFWCQDAYDKVAGLVQQQNPCAGRPR